MRTLALLFCLLANLAAADVARIEAAWRDWVEAQGVLRSAIAMGEDGDLRGVASISMDADGALPLASLSKAITGACIMAMVDEGQLHLDAPLSTIFEDRPDLMAPDAPGADIRVEQLLTHTSGLWPDGTQNPLNPTIWFGGADQDRLTRVGLSRPRADASFRYNNVNFAVLGSVIEVVSGQPVEDACRSRVLNGLTSPAPDGRLGGGLAWGGWAMTLADYYRFASGLRVRNDWPRELIGDNGQLYGPGILFAKRGPRTVLWHGGALCLGRSRTQGHNSYVLVDSEGWGAVVWLEGCVDADAMLALDAALYGAIIDD